MLPRACSRSTVKTLTAWVIVAIDRSPGRVRLSVKSSILSDSFANFNSVVKSTLPLLSREKDSDFIPLLSETMTSNSMIFEDLQW